MSLITDKRNLTPVGQNRICGLTVVECVGRMLQMRALGASVVLWILSYCFRCSPSYQVVVHSNCDNSFSLGRGKGRCSRFYLLYHGLETRRKVRQTVRD